MTQKEFETTDKLTDFQKRCLYQPIFKTLWEKASNFNEFRYLVRGNEEAKLLHGTAELLKDDRYYVREQLGDNQFVTTSDAGGVCIFNDNFSLIIPNGYGDGDTFVAIVEDAKDKINLSLFKFFTSVKGTFMISGYDCKNTPIRTLTGRYGIYYNGGNVLFERWE